MRPEWISVLDKVLAHNNPEDLNYLFELLLTDDERHAIAGRLKVFQVLLEGEMSQRQIAAEYEVSIATITRCSNYLKHMPAALKEKIRTLIL